MGLRAAGLLACALGGAGYRDFRGHGARRGRVGRRAAQLSRPLDVPAQKPRSLDSPAQITHSLDAVAQIPRFVDSRGLNGTGYVRTWAKKNQRDEVSAQRLDAWPKGTGFLRALLGTGSTERGYCAPSRGRAQRNEVFARLVGRRTKGTGLLRGNRQLGEGRPNAAGFLRSRPASRPALRTGAAARQAHKIAGHKTKDKAFHLRIYR